MYLKIYKRSLDIALSIVLIAITSWVTLLIVLVYVLTFQFPIFFRQQRIGKNEKFFSLLKFRTLRPTGQSLKDRTFWFGNFLRFTSLDELPQLINVLCGEMSLIGPRPLPTEYLPLFSATQRKRHMVLPGITGWAQVNGRHSIRWDQKFKYDIYYVTHLSFSLDLKILLKTIILVLSFRKDTSLQEEKFTGNSHA